MQCNLSTHQCQCALCLLLAPAAWLMHVLFTDKEVIRCSIGQPSAARPRLCTRFVLLSPPHKWTASFSCGALPCGTEQAAASAHTPAAAAPPHAAGPGQPHPAGAVAEQLCHLTLPKGRHPGTSTIWAEFCFSSGAVLHQVLFCMSDGQSCHGAYSAARQHDERVLHATLAPGSRAGPEATQPRRSEKYSLRRLLSVV